MNEQQQKREHSPHPVVAPLSGPWAVLLRVALATHPLLLGWCIWVTVQEFNDIAFRERQGAFSKQDAELLDAQVRAELLERISALPNADWRQRIIGMESDIKTISARQERILAILDVQAPAKRGAKPGGP